MKLLFGFTTSNLGAECPHLGDVFADAGKPRKPTFRIPERSAAPLNPATASVLCENRSFEKQI